MKINKIEMNGYTLYYIPNKKFKTFTVGAYFFRPLNKDGLVESSILSNMLMKYNQNHPTEQALSKYLEEMYGMSLYVGFNRSGLVNNMNFIVRSVNDKFLKDCDCNLFTTAVDLLNDTINLPVFTSDGFTLEKNLLIEDIKRVYDNKNQYATLKFIEAMHPHETCRYSVASSLNRAQEINLTDVENEYQNLMKAKKVFYVIGDIEEDLVKEAFAKIKFEETFDGKLEFLDYETKTIEKINEVIEKQNNNQSIVLKGYRSEIRECDDLYNGMFLLNNMLGGYFHSTLFQEVREKNSLAYSISSDYNSAKGTFVIHAGISANKFNKFKEIVNKIISDYQNGLIDDKTMEITKKMLINAQYKIADQPSYGVSAIIKEVAGIEEKSTEEKVEIIKKITKEEVMKAAQALKLDTIFMLEGNL